MVWDDQREREKEMLWGLPSRDPEVFQIPLLKSETAIIDRPCLLLANEFGLVKRGKTVYAASLISDEPFFRSEEHTSELQSLMRISYAVFCLKKKNIDHKANIILTYTTTINL